MNIKGHFNETSMYEWAEPMRAKCADRRALTREISGLFEQGLSALDPTLEQVLMGTHAYRRAELCGEMHPAQPGDLGQVLQPGPAA